MKPIEDFSNWLTDMDSGWWPLVNLRPQKNKNIDNTVLFKITPFFGSVSGVIIFFLCEGSYSILNFTLSLLLGWVAFFIVYKFSFAIAWNRRASRLRAAENPK